MSEAVERAVDLARHPDCFRETRSMTDTIEFMMDKTWTGKRNVKRKDEPIKSFAFHVLYVKNMFNLQWRSRIFGALQRYPGYMIKFLYNYFHKKIHNLCFKWCSPGFRIRHILWNSKRTIYGIGSCMVKMISFEKVAMVDVFETGAVIKSTYIEVAVA